MALPPPLERVESFSIAPILSTVYSTFYKTKEAAQSAPQKTTCRDKIKKSRRGEPGQGHWKNYKMKVEKSLKRNFTRKYQ